MFNNLFSFCCAILAICLALATEEEERLGHLERLGKQRPSEGHIDILEEMPDPISFHEKYVLPSRPCVFKGAAKNIPAYHKWTDEYLREEFSDLEMDIEEGKKENRSMAAYVYTMKDFVDKYKTEDVYLVQSIQKEMRRDIQLIPALSCGGFHLVMQDIVMWFSSGGTSSVLHFDMIDNVNCLFSGTKDLFMIDKKYEDSVPMDDDSGSYSKVDVDAVDLDKYKTFSDLPWWEAKMEAGDCLYIPMQWYHQVRSAGRNIAVNVWFTNMPVINTTDCELRIKRNRIAYVPIENLPLKSVEGLKTILKLVVGEKGFSASEFLEFVKKNSFGINKRGRKSLLLAADVDKDKHVTQKDIDNMSPEGIKAFLRLTTFGFASEGYDEEELEGQDLGQRQFKDNKPKQEL